MLNNVVTDDLVEMIIGERIRKAVEVVNHIGMGARVDINADRAGTFAESASQVEDIKCRNARGSRLLAFGL